MAAFVERLRETDGLSWTERLVAPTLATVVGEGVRALWGLLLAAIYGLALGTRQGGAELWQHALGVPAGLAAVALVGVPSLFVFLALVDAPISSLAALSVAARALGVSGLMLAGLAPAAALFVVTIESGKVAAFAGLFGLLLAGGIGLVHLLNGLSRQLRHAGPTARAGGNAALAAFLLFAIGLCLRVWWGLLPIFGGAS
jgi:hypothetical protein